MTRHIVLIHRYFSPDTPPYASILRDLAEHMGACGYRVTVLTCQPSYNRAVVGRAPMREQLASNVTVVRWPVLDDRNSRLRKALNLLWFCLLLVGRVPRLGRIDVIMAASTPPIAVAGVAAWLSRRKGAAFVYHKQDIYPEVVVKPKQTRGALLRLLRRIDAHTDRSATRVVVLSADMVETTQRRGVSAERIIVINNFDPWQLSQSGTTRPCPERASDELDVVFAGNLGRFQNLESVFEAMVELRDDPVRFHVFGDGPLRPALAQLVSRADLYRVETYGYRDPDEVARFLLERADLGIVSLGPGVIRSAYPSKTMSYLRHGTPILALVESDSELAATVLRSRIGCTVEPGDVPGLVKLLRELGSDRSTLDGARARAKALYVDSFDRVRRLDDWCALFAEVAS